MSKSNLDAKEEKVMMKNIKNDEEDFKYYCEVCGKFDDLYDDEKASYYNKETFMDNHVRYVSDNMIWNEFIRRGLNPEGPYAHLNLRAV